VKKQGISACKAAAVYIGTVVGAGFATGQEILQFFARFGIYGLSGIIIATLLFIVFGYLIMDLGNMLHARSHMEIIRYAGGRFLGDIIDLIITVFLFGTFSVMIAGNGALFEQQLKLPATAGNIMMAVITALTVLTGINGVINSISFVVPFLLSVVLAISVISAVQNPVNPGALSPVPVTNGLFNNWFVASVLYVSYNTVTSVAILGPLGNEAKDRKSILYGAILGGGGLGFGAAMIYLALSGHMAYAAKLEVPMLYIAGNISPILQAIYSIVLVAEIYTTAVSSLFGFTTRITGMFRKPVKGRYIVACSTAVALLSSYMGFSNLVKYLYPLIGYCGIIILASLLVNSVRVMKRKHAGER